jgi:hypothetical protein
MKTISNLLLFCVVCQTKAETTTMLFRSLMEFLFQILPGARRYCKMILQQVHQMTHQYCFLYKKTIFVRRLTTG